MVFVGRATTSSFSASYSPTTNRMTTIGSSTPTYDANGNITNDFLHTYAWDANGRPVTIDTITATYDALGTAAEPTPRLFMRPRVINLP